MAAARSWDIFCKVIDNHGDLGVCWRLSRDLATRGHRVRLWVDHPEALAWMAPQGAPGIEVVHWGPDAQAARPSQVVVEAFGCEPPEAFVRAMADAAAAGAPSAWINLEYLSAESWVERCHALPSPVMSGPGAGLTRHFFYPGFTSRTGGLLRETDLQARQAAFDASAWLRTHGIDARPGERRASLFCYEPPALPELLQQLAHDDTWHLLVTPGRAAEAVRAALDVASAAPRISWLPALPQPAFDELLWACDLNFVRGEDSLVRALWAGQAFVWHIYPQHDDAHHSKLDAFLDWMAAPASLRDFMRAWNGIGTRPLPPPDLVAWRDTARQARARALAQTDLTHQLIDFAAQRLPAAT
jgi:uncharacterized repeat protein (TIGR03837 family)